MGERSKIIHKSKDRGVRFVGRYVCVLVSGAVDTSFSVDTRSMYNGYKVRDTGPRLLILIIHAISTSHVSHL